MHQSFVKRHKCASYHPALDCASLTTSFATCGADFRSYHLRVRAAIELVALALQQPHTRHRILSR